MCEHVGLECPAAGCFCECGRCEAIRRDYAQPCEACGGRGGFAATGEMCSDCLGTGAVPLGQEARHAAEFKSLDRPEWLGI